jgi:hypothetical protein
MDSNTNGDGADDSTNVNLDLEGSTSGDSSNDNSPHLLTSQGDTGGDPALSEPWGIASRTPV